MHIVRGLCRAALALTALAALSSDAAAAKPKGRLSDRRVKHRGNATLVVRKERLPWYEHDAYRANIPTHRIETKASQRALIRRTIADSPIQDGSFTRTVRTLIVRDATSASRHHKEIDGFQRLWTTRQAPQLYTSRRLGPRYRFDKDRVHAELSLFSPDAQRVHLVLEDGSRVRMRPDRAGVWWAKLTRRSNKLFGSQYHFEVDSGDATGPVEIGDPHAQLAGEAVNRSRFADLRFEWTDRAFRAQPWRRWTIQEAHLKDLSAHASSPVAAKERGTFAGALHPAVLNLFKGKAAELLPIMQKDHGLGGHWGYSTQSFLAPEPSYAKRARAAHHELMSLINGLHAQNTPVILDVVFNHTSGHPQLHFRANGRSYYYRLDPNGRDFDGAWCGNEFATERPMTRKFIIAALMHWVEHYHVDGFRLDLGGLIDLKTLRALDRVLPKRIFLTMEPWAADWTRKQFGKEAMREALKDTRFTIWNDDFREPSRRFIAGDGDATTRDALMSAVAGSVFPFGWADRPGQSVPSVGSHDEKALAVIAHYDKKRAFMANLLLLTAQGVPMLHQGQDTMHDKKGQRDTWKEDNEINHLDHRLVRTHADLKRATDALVAIRGTNSNFHYKRGLTDQDVRWLRASDPKGLGYLLRPYERGGRDIVVLLNSGAEKIPFELGDDGPWRVVADGDLLRVDSRGLLGSNRQRRLVKREGERPASYEVSPGTGVMLMRD